MDSFHYTRRRTALARLSEDRLGWVGLGRLAMHTNRWSGGARACMESVMVGAGADAGMGLGKFCTALGNLEARHVYSTAYSRPMTYMTPRVLAARAYTP